MRRLTLDIAGNELYRIFKNNAPVRTFPPGPVGKKGTNMYSPYPGNLMNNGIWWENTGANSGRVALSGTDGKVGYLPYTETRSRKPGWQEKSVNEFVSRLCSVYGGKRV